MTCVAMASVRVRSRGAVPDVQHDSPLTSLRRSTFGKIWAAQPRFGGTDSGKPDGSPVGTACATIAYVIVTIDSIEDPF
jgi:hypothetical protein